MVKRTGRFGDFLVEDKPRPVKPKGKKAQEAVAAVAPPFILNLDKKGNIKFPSPPPLVTDIACQKCGAMMNLRDGKRGQLVELEGSGSEAEVRAALERVRQQVSWLTASSSGIGKGTFFAQLRMVCTVPPRATPGICAAPSPTR